MASDGVVIRPLVGLMMMLTIAGCADSKDEINASRCEDLAEESQECKDCKKALAEEDPRRIYELRRAVDAAPSWMPPTSLPS
jgi:hypothetical protein